MKNVRTSRSIYITCGTLITLSCIERCIKFVLYNSFNLEADIPEILIFWELRKLVTRPQSGSKLTAELSPDPLSPTPSASSTMMTRDSQSSGTDRN